MKRIIALLLSLLLALSFLTACGQTQSTEEPETQETIQTPVEEEPVEEEPIVEETPVEEEEPVEEAPVEEVPVEPAKVTYTEAVAVVDYLAGLDDAAKADPTAVMTGAQANQLLNAVSAGAGSMDEAATAVQAGEFLTAALNVLYVEAGEDVMSAARLNRLLSGLTLAADTELTVEQGAQILRNALVRDAALASALGLTYTVLPDYPNGYNSVSGQWTESASGTAITEPTVAAPVAVYGYARTWCDILTDLGYTAEGNNSMVTLQNSFTGGEFTVKYEKCHWDADGSGNIHSGCSNDQNVTNELNTTMEIYQISENEYRNIYKVNFLGKITDQSLTLYGYNSEIWGPWAIDTLPEDGWYIVNYYWNAYGAGEGLDVVQAAESMVGTLESITDSVVVIDGVEYTLSYVFNYGANMAKAPTGVGKQFTWFLDQHGQIVGCGEYFGEA